MQGETGNGRPIPELVELLTGRNTEAGCRAMQALSAHSVESDAVYAFFDAFLPMLTSANSYVRTRGLTLIIENARWDAKNRVDGVIDEILSHVTDEKPITARLCVQLLPQLANSKPALRTRILAALRSADTSRYRDSMRPLVDKDIALAIAAIERESPTP